MNAIFLKIALIVKTILAALGMGGCLTPRDIDILDEVIDECVEIEQTIEHTLK